MADLRAFVESELERVGEPTFQLTDLTTLRDRKHRNQRIGTAALALVIAATGLVGLIKAFQAPTPKQPVAPTITNSNVSRLHEVWAYGGTWGSRWTTRSEPSATTVRWNLASAAASRSRSLEGRQPPGLAFLGL